MSDVNWERQYYKAVERLREANAELADLRASSVVYRVRCENPCCLDGVIATSDDPDEREILCPDCDNGWRLAEGVVPVFRQGSLSRSYYPDDDTIDPDFYVIPARLIEGDT